MKRRAGYYDWLISLVQIQIWSAYFGLAAYALLVGSVVLHDGWGAAAMIALSFWWIPTPLLLVIPLHRLAISRLKR